MNYKFVLHFCITFCLALSPTVALAESGVISMSPVARAVPFDNSTDGYTATNVQDALDETHVKCVEANDQTNATTTSGTDAVLTSMTLTPTLAGTYLVMFSTDINSNAAGAAISISFYLAAAQVTGTLRKTSHFDGGTLSAGAARATVAFQKLIAMSGSNTVDVRWSTSSGTATSASRTLTACRVGP